MPNDGERTIWCERHRVPKTPHLVELCQTRDDYWDSWEQGRGPGQWNPSMRSRGLGDSLAKLTSAIGIKPCGGCKERQALLNKFVPYDT